jgi:DNA-binding XRE family transcriptional regulator
VTTATQVKHHTHSHAAHLAKGVTRWISSIAEAKSAVGSNDPGAIWIVRKTKPSLVDEIAKELAQMQAYKKFGNIVSLAPVRPSIILILSSRFKKVVLLSKSLPPDQIDSVLESPDRAQRFIGGIVDEPSESITLTRGDLKSLVVSFKAFEPSGDGTCPDFKKFSVDDFGATLKFGNYEAAADALLYEYDPEFRRKLKIRRIAEENTIGASIRRLRMQRKLTRDDFAGVNPKTLERIENNRIRKPRPKTLDVIAKRLGVNAEELSTY